MRDLARTLTAADLSLLVVGTVIGWGIFLVPGAVLRQTGGHAGLALCVWGVGGILSVLGALTYVGELGAMKPEARGLYVYIRDAFGPLTAFLYGWTLFFVIASGSLATLAMAFSVEVVSVYDEQSPRAFPGYPGGTSLQRWQRDLLRRAMEDAGFSVYEWEWWHFDFKDWRRYPIQNLTFDQLRASEGVRR